MTQDGKGTGYSYSFDAENHLAKAAGMTGGPYCYVYDGFGLRVAKKSGANSDCTGGTVTKLYWRSLASTPARGTYFDTAYAPFGETYASSGTLDPAYTGQMADTAHRQDTAGGLYDFPAREYYSTTHAECGPETAGLDFDFPIRLGLGDVGGGGGGFIPAGGGGKPPRPFPWPQLPPLFFPPLESAGGGSGLDQPNPCTKGNRCDHFCGSFMPSLCSQGYTLVERWVCPAGCALDDCHHGQAEYSIECRKRGKGFEAWCSQSNAWGKNSWCDCCKKN